jgi:hypothetical protein
MDVSLKLNFKSTQMKQEESLALLYQQKEFPRVYVTILPFPIQMFSPTNG